MMRNLTFSNIQRGVVAAVAAFAIVLPATGLAQSLPSYAHPNSQESISGRITAINGTYGLVVNDDRGFVDDVTMHQGTIINPTGLRLQIGMKVMMLGHTVGSTFSADEIDTPYNFGVGFVPYGYPPYGYPYPYGYGYPYYGPYPYISVGGGFGWGGRRHH